MSGLKRKIEEDQYKISVLNIESKISKEDLRKKFKSCGEIKKMFLHRVTNKSNNAEIHFADLASVNKAMELNGTNFNANTILTIEAVKMENKIKELDKDKDLSNNNYNNVYSYLNSKLKQEQESEDNENESDSSSEGYNKFMDDYKKHFKSSHKIQRKKMSVSIEGEVDVSDLLGRANNCYINSQYDEAIKLFHEVITQSPELREPYQILSLIYEERGDPSKALSFLMLAAQLSHGEKEIWIRCANLNKQLKNLQQADYCLARAIKIEKNNQYLLYERAAIQEELGNFKKAASIFEKLFKFSPNAEILLLHISHLYEKLNIVDKSISVIENNLEKITRKLKVLVRLFDLYLKYEKYFLGYSMHEKLSGKEEYLLYVNNSHIKIRFLFCCLELSELKNNKLLSGLSDKIEEMILQEYLEDEDYNSDDSSNKIPDNLPDNSTIIDDIIKEFQQLNTEVEMENNLELLYKLFDILQKSNNIDKFIFMYEKLENNFANNSGNAFEINSWTEEGAYHFILTPEIYSKIGEHYLRVKNYQKALDFFLKCMKNGSKQGSDNVLIRFKLSEIYKSLGDYNSALEVLNSDNFVNKNSSVVHNINLQISIKEENEISIKEENENEDGFTEKNPFNLDEGKINRDFLQNQLDNSEQDDNNDNVEENNDNNNNDNHHLIKDYEQETQIPLKHNNDNFNFPIPLNKDLSLRGTRKSSFNFSEYNNIVDNYSSSNKKKFLGNKRIRLKSFQSSNNSIESYNFETYLRRRNSVKSTDSNNTTNLLKNLSSLKFEYDELNQEINCCRDLYIKLQESLIYLQQDDKKKFNENTFSPLRQILIYELKIEDFKNQLFYNILEKSTIKNYFKIKETVFDEFNYQPTMNIIDEMDKEEEEGPTYKESLFVRKTERNKSLERKKVRKTMELVEKQLNKLQNVDKFISQENFINIIVKFVQQTYAEKKYQESISILQLILNSTNFKQRNDYIVFNMHIYSILNNVQLGYHKMAFSLLKRLIVSYDLKDFSIFWVFLRNVSSQMNISHLRSFYYKLTYSEEMCKNIYLNSLLGNCYLQSGNYDMSLRHLDLLEYTKFNTDPFFFFQKALIFLFKSMSRKVTKKELYLLRANEFFNYYALKRNRSNPIEVLFNMGRFYQFIGHDNLAKEKYDQLISKMNLRGEKKDELSSVYMSAVYNYFLLLKKNGNENEAHKMIMDNIIIE